MRYGRAKAVRRTLEFFSRTVGLRGPPYFILVDGTFIIAMLQYQLPIHERMYRLLQQPYPVAMDGHHGQGHHPKHTRNNKNHKTSKHRGVDAAIQFFVTESTLKELEMLAMQFQDDASSAGTSSINKKAVTATAITASANNRQEIQQGKARLFENAKHWAEQNCQLIRGKRQASPDLENVQSNSSSKRLDVSRVSQDVLDLVLDVRASGRGKQQQQQQQDRHINDGEVDSISPKCATINTENQKSGHSHEQQRHYQRLYLCATQDERLLDRLRQVGTVPVIRLARGSVLLLEHPSQASLQRAKQHESSKWSAKKIMMPVPAMVASMAGKKRPHNHEDGSHDDDDEGSDRDGGEDDDSGLHKSSMRLVAREQELVRALHAEQAKRQLEQQQSQERQLLQQRGGGRLLKRAKGPNPLSCKKKKNIPATTSKDTITSTMVNETNDIDKKKNSTGPTNDADRSSSATKKRRKRKKTSSTSLSA